MGAIRERPADLTEAESPVLTYSFLHPGKSFFPSDIDVNHWQLHHLITSPEEDQIYFVEDTRICRLNIVTRQKDVVSELPFRPSCTAAGFGWFCAGDDNHDAGYFAYLRVGDVPSQSKSTSGRSSHQPRHPPIQVVKWAKKIVNSISLHELPSRNGDDAQVVAVVTNNDNSVCVYSLSNEQILLKLHFDFAMNHATISPNGIYLVAVGDEPWLYVYKINSNSGQEKAKNTSMPCVPGASPSWEFIRKVRLHKPSAAEKEAYFTTAWSPESTLLATASQNGYITLIDASALDELDDDPTLIVTQSSNPPDPTIGRGPGSVRTMAFLPSPWDFLLWVEHSGTACLGDLRDGLHTRQVISLDSMGDDITMLDIEDFSDLPDLEPADEAQRASDADVISGLAPSQSRTTTTSSPIDTLEGYPYTLTDDERQIIDGLRTTREREAAELQRRLDIHTPQRRFTPVSIRYPMTGPSRTTRAPDETESLYMGHGARRSSFSASRDDGTRPVITNSDASGLASVRASASERLSNRPMNWSNFLQSSDTIRSVVRQELLRAREDNGAGQRNDAEVTTLRRSETPLDVDARLSNDLVNHQIMRAQRARQRRAQVAEAIPTRWMFGGGRDNLHSVPGQRIIPYQRIDGDEITEMTTTGHVVSEDGRTLYIGTTKGIFQLHPDFRTRRYWPSYETR